MPRRSLRGPAIEALYRTACDHALARHHAVADANGGRRAARKIDVDARAEADDADAVAGGQLAPGLDAADDPPGHQARDERETHGVTRGRRDDDHRALVVVRRGVLHGGEELPALVVNADDLAGDRAAADVNVEHVHED